jgi:queuine tRNA-ribosyltransferase
MLLTWHNIRYYQTLMARIRAAIVAGRFAQEAEIIQAGWTTAQETAA